MPSHVRRHRTHVPIAEVHPQARRGLERLLWRQRTHCVNTVAAVLSHFVPIRRPCYQQSGQRKSPGGDSERPGAWHGGEAPMQDQPTPLPDDRNEAEARLVLAELDADEVDERLGCMDDAELAWALLEGCNLIGASNVHAANLGVALRLTVAEAMWRWVPADVVMAAVRQQEQEQWEDFPGRRYAAPPFWGTRCSLSPASGPPWLSPARVVSEHAGLDAPSWHRRSTVDGRGSRTVTRRASYVGDGARARWSDQGRCQPR